MIEGPVRATDEDLDAMVELADICFSHGMRASWPACTLTWPRPLALETGSWERCSPDYWTRGAQARPWTRSIESICSTCCVWPTRPAR